jgi:hypothetical protein
MISTSTFKTTKRTGKYRIIKETNLNGDFHFEVSFETISVDQGVKWDPATLDAYESEGIPYKKIMKFTSEKEALMFINEGMISRKIVKEGRVDYV